MSDSNLTNSGLLQEAFKDVPRPPIGCMNFSCFCEKESLKNRLYTSVEISELTEILDHCLKYHNGHEGQHCGTDCEGYAICDNLRLGGLVEALKDYIKERNERRICDTKDRSRTSCASSEERHAEN